MQTNLHLDSQTSTLTFYRRLNGFDGTFQTVNRSVLA
jgi:hypothetical protein